jgi:predicted MFS family arabinose efflux permease
LAVFSWRVILQGSIIPALVFGLLIWVLLKFVPTQSGGVPNFRIYVHGLWGLFRNRRLLVVLLLTGAFAGGQGTVLTFFPVYLREDLGYSSFSTSVFLFLAQVAGIAVQPIMGYASDRFGRKAVMIPSLLILGSADVALSVVPDGWALILTVVVMGAFLFSLMSIFLAAASDLVGASAQATIVSLVFGAAVAVAGILPTIAGSLADALGNIQVAFVCAGVVVLCAGILGIVLKWQPSD